MTVFVFAEQCHSEDWQSAKFFCLTCLGYRKLPNSKTTWKCTNCKKNYAKPFHESTAISTGTCQDNPVATTTCSSSQSHDGKPESYEFDNPHDSDSEEESADDIEVTMVTTCESERHRSVRNLNEQDYQLILSPMVRLMVQLSIGFGVEELL